MVHGNGTNIMSCRGLGGNLQSVEYTIPEVKADKILYFFFFVNEFWASCSHGSIENEIIIQNN